MYDRKTRWKKLDDDDALHGDWRTNYSSLKEHEEQVVKQYEAEIAEDLMEVMTLGEAIDRFGATLVLAATGAIAKKGGAEGGEVRVIYDGTHGVFLNLSLIHI